MSNENHSPNLHMEWVHEDLWISRAHERENTELYVPASRIKELADTFDRYAQVEAGGYDWEMAKEYQTFRNLLLQMLTDREPGNGE